MVSLFPIPLRLRMGCTTDGCGRYSTEQDKPYRQTLVKHKGKGKMLFYPPAESEDPSPMYEGLHTNLPNVRASLLTTASGQDELTRGIKELMAYRDFPFPQGTPLFPDRRKFPCFGYDGRGESTELTSSRAGAKVFRGLCDPLQLATTYPFQYQGGTTVSSERRRAVDNGNSVGRGGAVRPRLCRQWALCRRMGARGRRSRVSTISFATPVCSSY